MAVAVTWLAFRRQFAFLAESAANVTAVMVSGYGSSAFVSWRTVWDTAARRATHGRSSAFSRTWVAARRIATCFCAPTFCATFMADRVLVASANATLDVEVPTGTRNVVLDVTRLAVRAVVLTSAVFLACLTLYAACAKLAPARSTTGWNAFGSPKASASYACLALATDKGVAAAFSLPTV
jgi:hypothetical protein